MSLLSIIIPAFGKQERLDETILSVLENVSEGMEVLVVHRPDYRDPYDLGDVVTFVEAPADASEVKMMNKGVAASSAEIVYILRAGCQVHSQTAFTGIDHFRSPNVAAVSPMIVSRNNHQKVLAVGLRQNAQGRRIVLGTGLRSNRVGLKRFRPMGPTLNAGIYRKSAIQAVGGFCEQLNPLFSDADMASLLHANGFECVVESAMHVTSVTATEPRRGFRTGFQAEQLYRLHRMTDSPTANLAHLAGIVSRLASRCVMPDAWSEFFGHLAAARKPLLMRETPELSDGENHSLESRRIA